MEAGAGVAGLVQDPEALLHVVVDGAQGGHDGGGAEAVGDGGEVGQVSLDAGLQHGLRPGVAQGAPVLVEKLSQLVTHVPGNRNDSDSYEINSRVGGNQ